MSILYSKTAHAAGGSGFFFDTDKNAPADAFPVSSADHATAINLNVMQPGATYDFTAPVAPATVGTLSVTAPTSATLLAQAQAAQISVLEAAYVKAIATPVVYMNTTFQADPVSRSSVAEAISAGSVPSGFFWNDSANNQVSMSFVQLQGLSSALQAQKQTAFAHLQTQKAAVRAATSVSAVQAIVW